MAGTILRRFCGSINYCNNGFFLTRDLGLRLYGRVANLSIATDESYINRQTGDKVDKTEWHRVVTFQDGLIDMFQKHATKGRLVYIDGKLQTRRWSKPDENGDRFSTEILLVPGGRVQFLDKPNGNGVSAQPDPAAAGDTGAAPAEIDDGSAIPF